MTETWYVLVPSQFGTLTLFWQQVPGGPRVCRVLLPADGGPTTQAPHGPYADARAGACPEMQELAERMTSFLAGSALEFPLQALALEQCSGFQQRVLRAEHAIPRGWVSTYGRIAGHLDRPGAARAVGQALANNPFPILIPCHRAIRSDGALGGFQGGSDMKRVLLEREGIQVSPAGRVLTDRICY